MSKQHHHIAGEHFSKRTRTKLAKKGIFIIGIQMVPGNNGYFDARTCFCLDNNDTHQVRDYLQVLALANEA